MKKTDFDDLKQFILATVSQSEIRIMNHVDTKIDDKVDGLERKLDGKIDSLRTEMEEGFAGVGQAIDILRDDFEKYASKADLRLSRLEWRVFGRGLSEGSPA